MVVSRDWQEVAVLQCILNSLHIEVSVESDADRARTRFSKSKVDALIVDRDLSGSQRLIESLRPLSRNGNSGPLLLMSASPDHHDLAASGATFFFQKPISVEQAVRTLSAARNMMLNGRLRYHRQALNIPVSLSVGSRKFATVHLMNLSRGGIGIRAARPIEVRGPVKLSFVIPGIRGSVKAKGELAWTDGAGNAGFRFLEIPVQQQRNMQLWLEKQYFAD